MKPVYHVPGMNPFEDYAKAVVAAQAARSPVYYNGRTVWEPGRVSTKAKRRYYEAVAAHAACVRLRAQS